MKLNDLCTCNKSFLEARADYQDARIILLGAPLDITSSFRMGSRDAPQAVRAASQGLEDYSPRLDRDLGECSFYDAGDLFLPLGNLQDSLSRIGQACRIIAGDGKIPFMLGGEHLVTLPAVQAMAGFFPGLSGAAVRRPRRSEGRLPGGEPLPRYGAQADRRGGWG